MTSTLLIDGFEIRGSAHDVLALYNSVRGWLIKLEREGRRDTALPITGVTSDGERTGQIVRLRVESTLSITLISDGTLPDSFFDGLNDSNRIFNEVGTADVTSALETDHPQQ